MPLDPDYPTARLQTIIEDSELGMVLTQSHLLSTLNLASAKAVALDKLEAQLSAYPNTQVEALAQTPDHPAYVIYTSGSTGKPKGVTVRHGNTVAMLYWAKGHYSQAELSRVLASTSLNFDLSVFELFVPLSFGHECVLVNNALLCWTKPSKSV